jgi:PE family
MSYVVAAPDYLAAAATDLANIGSTITEANVAAAAPTSQVLAAGADEVSAAVASLFSGHAQAYQALSAQVRLFHQQFVQAMTAAQTAYASTEAASALPLQGVAQELQSVIAAPAQTLLGGTSFGGLNSLLSGGLPNLNLGGLSGLLSGGLPNINLGGLNSLLSGGLPNLNLGGLPNLLSGGLPNLNLGGLNGLVSGALSKLNLGNLNGLLTGGLSNLNLGGIQNIPYNLFADVVNIPYYESLALKEYAFALGPAGQVGGVAGWIPPGATLANGGVKIVNGQPYYALGGTGSWYMESIGNTWGWDDGNWPQVDALFHVLLPFQFTESAAVNFQTFAQAELIPGSHLDNEFSAGNPFGYLGGWIDGHTPISQLIHGTTFPTSLTDTVGGNSSTGVINVGPPGTEHTGIWAGQPAQLHPGATLQAIGANLTASPAQNPIMGPNGPGVLTDAIALGTDLNTSFNPFVTGSYIYWGAPVDYSIPAAIGGTIQNVTGIPNQFPLINHGGEPLSGYTTGPSSLLTGLPEGGRYLKDGLLGYLNPAIYGQAIANDIAGLSNPAALLGNLPLVGYLVDPTTLFH